MYDFESSYSQILNKAKKTKQIKKIQWQQEECITSLLKYTRQIISIQFYDWGFQTISYKQTRTKTICFNSNVTKPN